jgi:hypothetical protein
MLKTENHGEMALCGLIYLRIPGLDAAMGVAAAAPS